MLNWLNQPVSQRRLRPVGVLSPECLESRALLSATKFDVPQLPVAADVQPHSRPSIQTLQVAGTYDFGGNDFGDGTLIVTQNGNDIHGEITAPLVTSASFDATFLKESAKTAKGTIHAHFVGDPTPSIAKFKIKFKVFGQDLFYFYKTSKFQPDSVQ